MKAATIEGNEKKEKEAVIVTGSGGGERRQKRCHLNVDCLWLISCLVWGEFLRVWTVSSAGLDLEKQLMAGGGGGKVLERLGEEKQASE